MQMRATPLNQMLTLQREIKFFQEMSLYEDHKMKSIRMQSQKKSSKWIYLFIKKSSSLLATKLICYFFTAMKINIASFYVNGSNPIESDAESAKEN